jgi:hypothetical protein
MIRLHARPLPLPRQYAGPTTHRKTEKERQFADGGVGDMEPAESYDRKKAWFSINYSILSVSHGTWLCAYHAEIWPQRPRLKGTGA